MPYCKNCGKEFIPDENWDLDLCLDCLEDDYNAE